MALFDSWHVSGVTTDAAKDSAVFHHLASFIAFHKESEFTAWSKKVLDKNTLDGIVQAVNFFIAFEKYFDSYFNKGNKKQKDSAIKFLVIFSSYCMAKDQVDWDWQQVRQLSQGLYGSMEKSPAHFLRYNTPLIEGVITEVNDFIDEYNQNLIFYNRLS